MAKTSTNAFELVILIAGIIIAALGFYMINSVYSTENKISWIMVIAILSWLTLLILFISLSITVHTSKRQLEELKKIAEEMKHSRRKLI